MNLWHKFMNKALKADYVFVQYGSTSYRVHRVQWINNQPYYKAADQWYCLREERETWYPLTLKIKMWVSANGDKIKHKDKPEVRHVPTASPPPKQLDLFKQLENTRGLMGGSSYKNTP